MKQKRVDQILLGISIGSFLLMSVSFLIMSVPALRLIPGLMFWIGLGLGVITQISLEARRRAFFKRYKVKRENMQKPRNGLLSFGSHWVAMIADGAMTVSLIATVLAFVLTKGYGYVCYVSIAVLAFTFCLHCILNGRIFVFVKNQTKIRQVLEQKKANSTHEGVGEK